MIWRVVALHGPDHLYFRPAKDVDHVPGWPQQLPAIQVYTWPDAPVFEAPPME